MFSWPCTTVNQYSDTNLMHFLFSLLRIKGLYMFRALLAHPQDALHKRHLVSCMRVMSVGYTRCSQLTYVTRTQHTKFILIDGLPQIVSHHKSACVSSDTQTTCVSSDIQATCLLRHSGHMCLLRHSGHIFLLRHSGHTCLLRHSDHMCLLGHSGHVSPQTLRPHVSPQTLMPHVSPRTLRPRVSSDT
jgi:hypothetical protein